jgi:hypothetical protein
MPLDPSIPLAVRPPQSTNPIELVSQFVQLHGVRDQQEAPRLAAEEARTRRLRQQQIDAAY